MFQDPQKLALLETAQWAVDIIKMYDQFLVKLGQPQEKVFSEAHKQGMVKAEAIIRQAVWDNSKCVPE